MNDPRSSYKQTFAQIVQVLRAVYFRTAIGDETWLAYFLTLADIPEEAIIQAVSEHLPQSDDFPTIAQLRRLALVDQMPAAGEAWREIYQQIQQVGHYRVPSYSHLFIAQVVAQMGGWQELCASDNSTVDRAHFLRIYEALWRSVHRRERSPSLKLEIQLVGQLASRLPFLD